MMLLVQAWFVYLVLVLGTRYILGSSRLGMLVRLPLALIAGALSRWFVYRLFAWEMRKVDRESVQLLTATVLQPAAGVAAVGAGEILLNTMMCPSCLGFWMGIAYAGWFPLHTDGALHWVLTGFVAMLISKVWYAFTADGDSFDHESGFLHAVFRIELGGGGSLLSGIRSGLLHYARVSMSAHGAHDAHDTDDDSHHPKPDYKPDMGMTLQCGKCSTQFAMFSDVNPEGIYCPSCETLGGHHIVPEESDDEEAQASEANESRG